MQSFGPKNFKFHPPQAKNTNFAIFQNRLGWPCPVTSALKNPSQELKFFFVSGADEYIERLEDKIRELLQCMNAFVSDWNVT